MFSNQKTVGALYYIKLIIRQFIVLNYLDAKLH
jgi:hypothetical protein